MDVVQNLFGPGGCEPHGQCLLWDRTWEGSLDEGATVYFSVPKTSDSENEMPMKHR